MQVILFPVFTSQILMLFEFSLIRSGRFGKIYPTFVICLLYIESHIFLHTFLTSPACQY